MDERPLSVTIVAWFLIVTSVLSAIGFLIAYSDPLTRQVMIDSNVSLVGQQLIAAFNLLFNVACGIGLLRRHNLARLVYIAVGVIGVFFGLLVSPFKLWVLAGAGLLAVIAYLLFRRPAGEWFADSEPAGEATSGE